MSKYGVFSGPYFPVFGLNTGKYGLEKTTYLDTFYAVFLAQLLLEIYVNIACFSLTEIWKRTRSLIFNKAAKWRMMKRSTLWVADRVPFVCWYNAYILYVDTRLTFCMLIQCLHFICWYNMLTFYMLIQCLHFIC